MTFFLPVQTILLVLCLLFYFHCDQMIHNWKILSFLKYKWHVLKEDKVRWVFGWGDKVGAEEKMWILTLIELQETSMEWISLGSEKSPTGKRLICSFLSNLKQPNIIFVTYLDSVLMKGSFFDNITVGKLRFWSKFGNWYIWIYAFWYLSRTIFQNKF